MNAWPDELRLIALLTTNVLMLVACWRLARRGTTRAVVALADTILYWLAAQYVITGTCGMLGVLWPGLVLSIAAAMSIGVLIWSPSPSGRGVRGEGVRVTQTVRSRATNLNTSELPPPSPQPSRRGRGSQPREAFVLWLGVAFVLAYVGAFIYLYQSWIPELATDPMVYHLPVAAHWLQDGRISLVDIWYWLPANSYSPLAGSVWIAWWIGPIGNDALSRFVQVPTWLLLFAAAVRLMRDLRVPMRVAATIGCAILIARPFITQVIISKDDIAVAALALTILGGLHARRLRDAASPYRLGIAFGLLISTKYPAILALTIATPAILTFRWWQALRLRGTLIAAVISLAFVAPWLIRNAIITGGNPFYPFFSGSGGFIPDPQLRSLDGIWQMLAQKSFALPPTLWAIVAVSAVALLCVRPRRVLGRDGVIASLLVGPLITITLLVATFPWPEVRYLFSAIAAALVLVGVACSLIRVRWAANVVAVVVLGLAFGTSLAGERLAMAVSFLISAIVAAVAMAGVQIAWRRLYHRVHLWISCGGVGAALVAIYVLWFAFLHNATAGYERNSDDGYTVRYPDIAPIWIEARHLPAGATIAYANTPTTWPLFGFTLQHRVVYAPVRPGITHLHDLPPIRERVPARDEYVVVTRAMNEGADAATWFANLDRLKADYLFVAKTDASNDPPELRFVNEHRERFETLAENEAAVLLRIRR